MSYYEKAKDLYQMMDQGQVNEAFEKYYAEDCVVCEKPTGEMREGKEAQRKAIAQWREMVKEHHGGGTGRITANEDESITMVESWMDVTMADGNRVKMEEVAVQQWNDDGQIVKEDFYYQAGPPPQWA